MGKDIISTTQRKAILSRVEANMQEQIRKYSDPDADKIDSLLVELNSNLFPVGNPVVKAKKSEIKFKLKKLMELIGKKGEDWEGLA